MKNNWKDRARDGEKVGKGGGKPLSDFQFKDIYVMESNFSNNN